jgi:hypothetical protein
MECMNHVYHLFLHMGTQLCLYNEGQFGQIT